MLKQIFPVRHQHVGVPCICTAAPPEYRVILVKIGMKPGISTFNCHASRKPALQQKIMPTQPTMLPAANHARGGFKLYL